MSYAQSFRRVLLAATVSSLATTAAQAAPAFAEDASMIVPRADLANNLPPPGGKVAFAPVGQSRTAGPNARRRRQPDQGYK